MQSLFNPSDTNEIITRINSLTATAKPEWGKMSADQMLGHAQRPLQVAFGELKINRTLIGFLFGGMAKKKLTSNEPWKRNLPTDKNFIVTGHRNFNDEKKNLVALVQRFAQAGPNGITKEPHPFFGLLTTEEWDALMWKHLDHHLKQFGV